MNPYENTHLNSDLPDDAIAPDSSSSHLPPNPYNVFHNPSLSATLESHPVTQTGHSHPTFLPHNSPPSQASSGQDGGEFVVLSPHGFSSQLTASDPGFNSRFVCQSSQAPVSSSPQTPSAVSASTLNPYSASATSCQVSVIIQSSDLCQSPLQSQCSEDTSPDLECSICFSQFNNVFRCPKMLQCKHTFCLECLARINIKSAEPNAIQCPLCRGLTPLPTLGLPKLATDSDVLSYLPAAMQRVYSIRFLRNKGKLQVKRSSEGRQGWGQRSLTSLRSMNRSLDVGLPSPPVGGSIEADGMGRALFRLTGRPACRAILLTSVVMMIVLLMCIIIFLLTMRNESNNEN